MTSNMTHDSGIHTMSSRRDSGMSDLKSYQMNGFRKSNSDCMPLSQEHFQRGTSTRSLDKLANQLQHCDFNFPDNILKSSKESSVFEQPVSSMHDLKSSLDVGIKYNQYGDPGGGHLDFLQRRNCYSNSNDNNFKQPSEKPEEYAYKGEYNTPIFCFGKIDLH